jgi:hypothetical protein
MFLSIGVYFFIKLRKNTKSSTETTYHLSPAWYIKSPPNDQIHAEKALKGHSLKLHFEFSSLLRIDKIAHLFLFGTETYLIAIASKKSTVSKSNFRIIFLAFVIGAVFGVIIEILQATVFPNRSFDYMDMIANTIGCLLAWFILNRRFKSN